MLGIRSIFLTVVILWVFGLDGITQVVATASSAAEQQASNAYLPFEGNKTTWYGFDRYDFIMDDATGAITPMTAPESEVTSYGIDVSLKDGKRRCVVVVPTKAAPGYPWSWRGCYWNVHPQTEVELLKRGFHIAFVAPDSGRQGKAWDTWYNFMTAKHGLSKKAAFIGMSKGGVNVFNWGVVNPEKVACIYADNPALYEEDFAKVPELARHDVPLLHICGTEDFILQKHTLVVENTYHQLGGLITVMIKEGHAHGHSLQNAKPIADWIEHHMTPSTANRPAFVDTNFTKGYYYSLEPSYIYLKEEDTYATARGPGFTECYDRYDGGASGTFRTGGMAIIVPKTVAPGKPWVFTGDPIERDATVEQALLAKGYHIVIVAADGPGMVQKQWDDIYKRLVDNGFSSKPVLKGTGAKAGEAYAWAIANPDKVSCIYARNPLMRSLMAGKAQPIDNLAALAKAGVPVLHDCGALDPWLDRQTHVVEKRYKELGGQITVIIREGEGHFPLSPKDPKTVVDFILNHQR
jgi:pimeloyl-ACP methyl ester carboxylesterase